MPRKIRVRLRMTVAALLPQRVRGIMISYTRHASIIKFTMVASFIILSLAIIQSEWYQHRNKPFSVVGQVIAKTKRNNPVDVQLNIQVKEQRYCHPSNLRMVLSLDFINTGKDRLIFFKDGHFTAAYTFSRTMEDALAKKYELDVSQFGSKSFLTKDFHDISPLIDTLTPSDDYFIVVVPGEVYRSEER